MKIRYIVIIAVLLLVVGTLLLGQNRYYAVKLAQAIITKDETGENVADDIQQLKAYVGAHMRSDVEFELKASYDRAAAAARKAAEPQIDPDIYIRAQASCAGGRSAVAQSRCVSDYVAAQPQAQTRPVVLPNRENYRYSFSSPEWTPDLAGLLLMASACLLAVSLWFKTFDYFLGRKTRV